MYKDDFERQDFADRNQEDVWSKPVRAGKRTYFFDVKTTKGNNDYYLTITESKRRQEADGSFSFDKHKIFLYKEDFDKFRDGLEEVIKYMRDNLLKDIPERTFEARKPEGKEDGGGFRTSTSTNFSFLANSVGKMSFRRCGRTYLLCFMVFIFILVA